MLHKALAVCWLFDDPGERFIRGLWRRLEDNGIPTPLTHTHGRHWPHLSLAVVRDWEFDSVQDRLAQLPEATLEEQSGKTRVSSWPAPARRCRRDGCLVCGGLRSMGGAEGVQTARTDPSCFGASEMIHTDPC